MSRHPPRFAWLVMWFLLGIAAVLLAKHIGDKPVTLVDATPVAALVCTPLENPCDKIACVPVADPRSFT